jgi:hypothetical protein
VSRLSSRTRDTSTWILNRISLDALAKPARRREALRRAATDRHRPLFGSSAHSRCGDELGAAIERLAARLFAAQVVDRAIALPLSEQCSPLQLRARAGGPADLRDRRQPLLGGRTRTVRRLQQRAPDRARRRRRLRAQRRHQACQRHAGTEIITFDGPELGRGRGGPRCMSRPIERDLLQRVEQALVRSASTPPRPASSRCVGGCGPRGTSAKGPPTAALRPGPPDLLARRSPGRPVRTCPRARREAPCGC